eukprot:g5145.t1
MEWGLELLQEPERCFLELQHARAAYRPGLGSFQWEVLATTRSERTDAELRVGSEPLLVATEVPQRSEELRVLGQVTTDSLPPDNIDVVIYLSFRGTVSQENMITNLKAELVPLTLGASAQGQVHRGFQETCLCLYTCMHVRQAQDAYLALRPRLLTKLDEVTADPSLLPARVLVRATGHSLGGVLAPRQQDLDTSAAAAALHWANAAKVAALSLSKVRDAHARGSDGAVSVAAQQTAKSAEAFFPHRLDAYERNLAVRLGPDAPCGRVFRGWDWRCWRRSETIQALEVVAQRYCNRPHVTGLAVCNEPSRLIPADVLASFYDQAVEVIRANGMSTVWESQWRFAGRPVDAPKAI